MLVDKSNPFFLDSILSKVKLRILCRKILELFQDNALVYSDSIFTKSFLLTVNTLIRGFSLETSSRTNFNIN